MLAELQTVKDRLQIIDVTDDEFITGLIEKASGLFDDHCNRKFARLETGWHEFRGDEVEIAVDRYPIELVLDFEMKYGEDTSWVPQAAITHVVRGGCIISLRSAMGTQWNQCRVMYTGGYVLPGTDADADLGQVALPAQIEQACVEQVAHWYRTRNTMGMSGASGQGGSVQFEAKSVVTPLHLLPLVQATLEPYRRIQL